MTDTYRATRHSRRLSITVPASVYDRLHLLAASQGRSASNLCGFMLERELDRDHPAITQPE